MWKTLMAYSVCLWCIGGCSPGVQSKTTSSMAEHDEVQPERTKIEVDDGYAANVISCTAAELDQGLLTITDPKIISREPASQLSTGYIVYGNEELIRKAYVMEFAESLSPIPQTEPDLLLNPSKVRLQHFDNHQIVAAKEAVVTRVLVHVSESLKASKGSGFFDDTESGAAHLDATERPKQ